MRVVVVGATGNVGTSLLQALAEETDVDSVVGVARRLPDLEAPKVEWVAADIVDADLAQLFRGADAVVHLAWGIQPARDRNFLWRVNVEGSSRVFRAVAEAGVGALVYASSVGAYSPGPKDRRVDESWPTGGMASSFYESMPLPRLFAIVTATALAAAVVLALLVRPIQRMMTRTS